MTATKTATKAQPPRFLTPAEVSKVLGVSVDRLKKWRSENRGPAHFKLEGLVRYHAKDLDEWIRCQRG